MINQVERPILNMQFSVQNRFEVRCKGCGKTWNLISDFNEDIYERKVLVLFGRFHQMYVILRLLHVECGHMSEVPFFIGMTNKIFERNHFRSLK